MNTGKAKFKIWSDTWTSKNTSNKRKGKFLHKL